VLSGSTCEEQEDNKDTVVLDPRTAGITSLFITQEQFGDRINITTIQPLRRCAAPISRTRTSGSVSHYTPTFILSAFYTYFDVFLTVHHSIDLFHLPALMHNSFVH
jgi:hypothetical protein